MFKTLKLLEFGNIDSYCLKFREQLRGFGTNKRNEKTFNFNNRPNTFQTFIFSFFPHTFVLKNPTTLEAQN